MIVLGYEHRRSDIRANASKYTETLESISEQFSNLHWIKTLLICGSYAKGSLAPGWSDLDLVAVYEGPLEHARLHEISLGNSILTDSEVPIGIDFVDWNALQKTRRVIGRPLAMTFELQRYARAAFGENPLPLIGTEQGDKLAIESESAALLRAHVNSWLRRCISGYADDRMRIFDAIKTLLRIAMFESSPLEKEDITVRGYCQALRSKGIALGFVDLFDICLDARESWANPDSREVKLAEESYDEIYNALVWYCELWKPAW